MFTSICFGIAIVLLAISSYFNFVKIKETKGIVDAHWAAIQHECNAIWGQLHDRDDGE